MIETTEELPGGVLAVRARGTLTAQDYRTVIEPMLDDAVRSGRRLRFLVEIGPDFTGVTPGGMWEDVRLGLRALRRWDGCAVVAEPGWLERVTKAVRFLTPFPVRIFTPAERDVAISWLAALPGEPDIATRTAADGRVLVVEVARPLRAPDVDALASAVGPWLDANDGPHGLVLHARGVPGWDNVATLARHVRFVRGHHRRIGRVALAVDGALATAAAPVVSRLLRPAVRHFDYPRLDEAIGWAAGSGA